MYSMPSPTSKLVCIDSHFHIFPAGQSRPGARYEPGYGASYEGWREAAAAVGVARGVVVQPSFLGTDNTRLCEELRQHADSLRGIAVVDPACSPGELQELAACGVRGVRLNLSGLSHDIPAWRSATATWDEMLRLGWHIELLADVGELPGVLAQVPSEMPVVIDHMARPAAASSSDATIAALKKRAEQGAVHVKLSGAYRLGGLDPRAVAQVLLGELGESSLLWGSDWPCTNHEQFAHYPQLLGVLSEWVGEDVAAQALDVNAQSLYWEPLLSG